MPLSLYKACIRLNGELSILGRCLKLQVRRRHLQLVAIKPLFLTQSGARATRHGVLVSESYVLRKEYRTVLYAELSWCIAALC